jgi:toxin YoeB
MAMKKLWFEDAWNDYLFWQRQDKKTRRKIHGLIKDIERNGYHGIGKPEPLKGNFSGWWSVRIDDRNRIVFRISGEGRDRVLEIDQCGSHYRDR